MLLQTTIDKTTRTAKPSSKDVKHINIQLSEMDVGELASGVAYQGWTIAPAKFAGSRSNENFKSQQLFMLDFDDGTTFNEALNICTEINIEPSFAYETFSSTQDHQKFRMAFTYPVDISGKYQRDLVQNQLMAVFSGRPDKSCKDAARLFYGSNNGLLYRNYSATIDPIILETIAASTLKDVYGNKYNRVKIT